MVTMAERLRGMEKTIDGTRSDIRDLNTNFQHNNEKLDTLIAKFDKLPDKFVLRESYDLVLKIAGVIGFTLITSTITLVFKVFSGGI